MIQTYVKMNLNHVSVFPLEETVDQFGDISFECNIESCTEHRLFWIHTGLTGDRSGPPSTQRIRYLPGDQVHNVNTLTMQGADFADTGDYSCMIARNQDDNFIANLPLNASIGGDLSEIDGGKVSLKVRGKIAIMQYTMNEHGLYLRFVITSSSFII